MHRTIGQWLALFAEQAQSGLAQTEFAKCQGIIPTYFSYRKRQLLTFQKMRWGGRSFLLFINLSICFDSSNFSHLFFPAICEITYKIRALRLIKVSASVITCIAIR